jgi:DNA-binding response OmpR family regulator
MKYTKINPHSANVFFEDDGHRLQMPVIHLVQPHEMRVRYVFAGDQHCAVRQRWISEVFQYFLEFPYIPDDTSPLSTAHSDFDVIVFGCNDLKRILPFYRKNRSVLRRKLVICLMRNSTPQRRAKVIYSGFDDAVDLDRTPPAEAVARIRAMWNRYQMVAQREAAEVAEDAALSPFCDVVRLTAKEKAVLSALIEGRGRVVSQFKLQLAGSRGNEQINQSNLRVTISILRRKLRDEHRIVCSSGIGYALLSRL